MPPVAPILTAGVSVLHGYFMVLEMFLWTTPRGRKTFKTTAEYAEQTKVLAANQGLYNGFLSAGLLWGAFHPVPEFAKQIQLFSLGCVVVAGILSKVINDKDNSDGEQSSEDEYASDEEHGSKDEDETNDKDTTDGEDDADEEGEKEEPHSARIQALLNRVVERLSPPETGANSPDRQQCNARL
ncbi:Fc.00g033510.m01.CDS01 [Cosmosporella sp. VM-42]